MRSFDDRGQIYTVEGFASALILVGVLFFIFQSISVVTPQTEMSGDMKLSQKAADTLICLDLLNEFNCSDLKTAAVWWDGSAADYGHRLGAGEANMTVLDRKIAGMMPNDSLYNLEISYNNGVSGTTRTAICGGVPGDNSVVATRLITINANDAQSALWRSRGFYPQLVEVRLVCWYI